MTEYNWTLTRVLQSIDSYVVENNNLLEQNSAAKDEVDKLSRQYATLLSHMNPKQKIQHVLQLKMDNIALKEIYKLRQETEWNQETIKRMLENY